uniref:Arrestin C-terminal-like domain-containing protein n=1 Tax=Panagrolaimus davidi TaxID=227884 RepID=A0A914Q9B8_9BILA
MTTVEIFLDSKTNMFFPNSEITGKICLNTNEAETIKKSECYNCCLQYESEHYYLNENECLWKFNETNQLLNGEYWFPFKFVIPSNAPSNVNEEFGEIQYFIKADIEFYGKKFWGYKKYNEFQYYGFSVCPIINLNNLDPKLKLSASTKITQIEDKFFSCTKNPLNVMMTLPKSGFVCGEKIPIKIEIKNKTSMKIESIEYGIELKCLYVGTYECLCFVETLNKETTFYVAKDFIKPESDSTICNILIPPISPTFTDCSILKLEYSVFVKVHTNAFFQSGPIISIPITIGTVPMKKIESEEPLNAMEILESANFLEGSNRCKMDGKYKEIEGPKNFQPKFACYSNLFFNEKLSVKE